MDFNFGYNTNQHKLTVFPKSQVVVFTHVSKPYLNGVYIPKPVMLWDGARKRPFKALVEYIADGDFTTLYNGEAIRRKTWLRVNFSYPPSRCIDIEFYPWIDQCDQTYVSFVKISDFYMDGFRLAQSRIRNNPRRLAMAMSLHPRIGKESVFQGLVGEDVLRIILDLYV